MLSDVMDGELDGVDHTGEVDIETAEVGREQVAIFVLVFFK